MGREALCFVRISTQLSLPKMPSRSSSRLSYQVRDQMLLLLNRAARLIDGSTNGYMFRLRSQMGNRYSSGVHGLSSTSNTDLNETTRNMHSLSSLQPQPMPLAQWGRIVVSDRKVWTESGYAKEHYVSAPPDTHALCLEFQVKKQGGQACHCQ